MKPAACGLESSRPSNGSLITITGLAVSERLRAIDPRPTNVKVYGLSNHNRLFTLDTA